MQVRLLVPDGTYLQFMSNYFLFFVQAVSSVKCSKWSRLHPVHLGGGEYIQTRGTAPISNLGRSERERGTSAQYNISKVNSKRKIYIK